MELSPGYKQTDAGLIPSDWEVRPLADLADKIMVGIASAATHAYRPTGVPLLRNQNIRSGHLDDRDLLFVDPAYEIVFKNKRLRGGDLLTARTGYPGTTCVVPPSYDLAQSFTTLITRPKKGEIDSLYLCHYVNSEQGQTFFTQGQIGGAQKNVNAGTLRQMPIPTPPLPEQRAIAAALSDVDALLDGLDRLIAKKRDLKQAAMQQLLTGQTRLPGFHGEWEVKRLGDVAEIVSGGTPRTNEPSYWNGGIKWCTPTDITRYAGKYLTETERSISRDGLKYSGAALLPVGALLLCSRATIGELKIAGAPVCTNQGFKSLVCRPEASNEFLYYKLLTMKQKMVERAFGSTFLEISTPNVSALEVAAPPHDEQVAIAAVLSDMDAELATLEARRDKTRHLKQAMMQELLTGKTRLVPTGGARV
ncbi:MAG: restriction endonuclease subunit S [Deltaproteobacteria bacterium]|nr:restriction endonuclease subunit S [Deltaproteobacteria bacterium]